MYAPYLVYPAFRPQLQRTYSPFNDCATFSTKHVKTYAGHYYFQPSSTWQAWPGLYCSAAGCNECDFALRLQVQCNRSAMRMCAAPGNLSFDAFTFQTSQYNMPKSKKAMTMKRPPAAAKVKPGNVKRAKTDAPAAARKGTRKGSAAAARKGPTAAVRKGTKRERAGSRTMPPPLVSSDDEEESEDEGPGSLVASDEELETSTDVDEEDEYLSLPSLPNSSDDEEISEEEIDLTASAGSTPKRQRIPPGRSGPGFLPSPDGRIMKPRDDPREAYMPSGSRRASNTEERKV